MIREDSLLIYFPEIAPGDSYQMKMTSIIIDRQMPSSFIFRTNQGKMQYSNTYYLLGNPSPVTINSIVASASPYIYPVTSADVSGTSITNGINYNVFSFASVSTTTSYTINYSCAFATTIYVLAVGGGGAGGTYGGGGGAGGVVMMPVYLQAGTAQTISINIGAGGAGKSDSAGIANNGSNTTVTFSSLLTNPTNTIIAYGGNAGTANSSVNTTYTGSSGGGSSYYNNAGIYYSNNGWNYASAGGSSRNNAVGGAGTETGGGGGGGAGGIGLPGSAPGNNLGGNGGIGLQCFLPGISNFVYSGTSYSTYYWGGGGGGSGTAGTQGSGGNGGLGGGGGGGDSGGGTGGSLGTGVGVGDGNAINSGVNGVNGGVGGNGGANTGGGGGGTWGAVCGSGGSGIVIIAFPSSTAITDNKYAVLPTSIYSNSIYSATLNNSTLTSLAYNSIKGAYACRLLNYNYFGPIMTLRYNTDTTGIYTKNFYADVFGNLGTSYLGTGTSVSAWLTAAGATITTYAFVTKWYNQGMDVSFNCATQYTTSSQPIYDIANGLINFGYTGAAGGVASPSTNYSFNLPSGAYPYNDSSYTYTIRHGYVNNNNNFQAITAGGAISPARHYCGVGINMGGTSYDHIWAGGDFNGTAGKYSASSNNIVTYKYTTGALANSRVTYVNFATTGFSMSYPTVADTIRAQDPSPNYIGYTTNWASYAGQLNYLQYFSTALSDADRAIIEATPYSYSFSATTAISGLSATNVTSTNFTLSWTAVASVSYYILWVDGSIYNTYNSTTTSVTVTPKTSRTLQALYLYAYNSSNVLLASGSTNAVIMATASVSINSGASQSTYGSNTIFTYTSSGTFTPTTTGYASVLMIGGGGSGGTGPAGGGGGAGGLIYFDAIYKPMLLTAGTAYTVTVGTGGVNTVNAVNGSNGTDSVFNSYIAKGGGGGGYYNNGQSAAPSGGCGGGGAYIQYGVSQSQVAGISTQVVYSSAFYSKGFAGGAGGGNYSGGGGGGAGGVGNPGITGGAAGSGGVGYQCNITGSNSYYGGGGGGCDYSGNSGAGGSGIGGAGSTTSVTSPGGAANTGSGGGGAGGGTSVYGGPGGSGVVIISCPGVPTITGLSSASVTSTTFILNWTSVSTATSYVLWINGTKYTTTYGIVTTTGTVTPGVSAGGPWTVNLYAYNTSNVLLSIGSMTVFVPIMYYPFNNDILNYATGTGVSDLTGTSNFVNSNPSGTGYCQNFGSAYCLLRSTAITLSSNAGSGITIAFWLNSNTTTVMGNYVSLFGLGNTSTSTTNSIYIQNTSVAAVNSQLQLCIQGLNTYIPNYNNTNLYTTSWQHIAFVWTVTDAAYNYKLDMYSNGSLISTITGTSYNTTYVGNCNYQRIGHRTDSNDQFFTGYMANWRFYNQPIAASDVLALYNTKK